jgi:hypothetical protein
MAPKGCGGEPLTSVTSTRASNVYTFDAANTPSGGSSATLAAVFGCLVYNNTLASPVADQGLCYNYFGGTQSVTDGTFTIIHTGGIFAPTSNCRRAASVAISLHTAELGHTPVHHHRPPTSTGDMLIARFAIKSGAITTARPRRRRRPGAVGYARHRNPATVPAASSSARSGRSPPRRPSRTRPLTSARRTRRAAPARSPTPRPPTRRGIPRSATAARTPPPTPRSP